jgi:pilus assembly protein Flp/PilA
MRKLLRKIARNEAGATAIEYGLIAAVLGVGILTAAKALRTGIADKYDVIVEDLAAAK